MINAKGRGKKGKIVRSGVGKFTGRMKRRVGAEGRGVALGMGASATIRDEFMAEEKSSCRWLL